MTSNVAYVFSEDFFRYDLGEGHPMSRKRLILTHKLLQSLKLVDSSDSKIVRVQPKTIDEQFVRKVHTLEYIEEVKRLSKTPGFRPEMGLGTSDCPVFKEMFETSMLIAGSTLLAGDLLLNGDYSAAFVLMGGLHHAFPARAAGFCYFNDLAILIKQLEEQGLRVAYIDTDLHHGDGVEHIFYDDPNVLTFSIHESGQFIFPGTGYPDESGGVNARGTKINFPLYKYTFDDLFLEALSKYLPPIVNQFKPDIVVWQAG
ncbi:MAG TPA: hypothetical protein VJ044_14180, partial [Candidatus Hodarchaeales archaeon]|nr:hypothetical protein [Candidatus Hodarchaeales archaeon]